MSGSSSKERRSNPGPNHDAQALAITESPGWPRSGPMRPPRLHMAIGVRLMIAAIYQTGGESAAQGWHFAARMSGRSGVSWPLPKMPAHRRNRSGGLPERAIPTVVSYSEAVFCRAVGAAAVRIPRDAVASWSGRTSLTECGQMTVYRRFGRRSLLPSVCRTTPAGRRMRVPANPTGGDRRRFAYLGSDLPHRTAPIDPRRTIAPVRVPRIRLAPPHRSNRPEADKRAGSRTSDQTCPTAPLQSTRGGEARRLMFAVSMNDSPRRVFRWAASMPARSVA